MVIKLSAIFIKKKVILFENKIKFLMLNYIIFEVESFHYSKKLYKKYK